MSLHEFIFSRGKKASVRRHIVLWIGCYLLLVLPYPPRGTTSVVGSGLELIGILRFYRMALIRCFFHLSAQMAFCYPFLYYLVPAFFRKKKYGTFFGLLLLLLGLATGFRFSIFFFVYNWIMRGINYHAVSAGETLQMSIVQNFDGPAFVGFLFISLKLFKDWQQRQQDNLDLRRENANAELLLLKAQIHPHFLFNTLNNIYSFALDRSPQARRMLKMLEGILHYMIEECQQPLVSLEKEVAVLKDYFELERIRYDNSIDMKMEIVGDCAGKVVSPLLMIPFVENSFKHGASKVLREPWVKLFIQADDDVVHFSLTNGKPAGQPENPNRGIGLFNVKKRLQLLYPDAHLLLIDSTTHTFTVNMQIPVTQL